MQLPPLSLYIHIPWCVQKCPYCDFNSHELKQPIPEKAYIQALLRDLETELALVQGRALQSIFIGGGTPSLLSHQSIETLLSGIKKRIPLTPEIEITMEANPGTAEAERFQGYFAAGVNRLSIGIQSFDAQQLKVLGRIHDPDEACRAVNLAQAAGFKRINLDLMHGLPGQQVSGALDDLTKAMSLSPTHISWYQLTIEPHTHFASKPPLLPEDDQLWTIFEQGQQLLAEHGFHQYEVSAYSQPNEQARHNLNYWRFGDYIGIGCGAHGKLTVPVHQQIIRKEKIRHPKGYLTPNRNLLDKEWTVASDDLAFEFFLNRLRLFEPIPKIEFLQFTGLPLQQIESAITKACNLKLLENHPEHWHVTQKGKLFLNELLNLFINDR